MIFSFYDAASNTSLSNTAAYSDDEGNTVNAPILSTIPAPTYLIYQGQTLIKVGSRTFLTSGTISSTNASYLDQSNNIRADLIKASTLALKGDSGGPCFIYDNGLNKIAGLTHACAATSNPPTYSTFLYSLFVKYSVNIGSLSTVIYRY